MKNKFISLICIIYSLFLSYLLITRKIDNYLAPSMQIYVIISIIPCLIIGIGNLFIHSDIKFDIKDLLLLLPIMIFIFSGDGKFTTSFASSRMSMKREIRTIEKKKTDEVVKEDDNSEYDINDIYFDVVDSTYSVLANYLVYTEGARVYAGKTIRVSGMAVRDTSYLNDGYFALGRYSITCCAADSEFTGFIIKYDTSKIKDNNWYQVEGVLKRDKDKEGYDILVIDVVNIKKIEPFKQQYVYQCNQYGNGKCEDLAKYDFVY